MFPYMDFIFGKLGSGVFLIYLIVCIYYIKSGDVSIAALWLRLSEAYITYNAASYLIAAEKARSLPEVENRPLNFFHWLMNNFFSRKVFVLVLAMYLMSIHMIEIQHLFEIGIFMLGGRMVEKFSRNVQHEMKAEKQVVRQKVTYRTNEEEGDA
ncbi:hypothetical protein GF337_13425 [candidate division KSB1 bacterium]|nr:hypothetical protein [candidate division KSB1 bacterium]